MIPRVLTRDQRAILAGMETTEYHDAEGAPVPEPDAAGVIELVDEADDGTPIFSISLPNAPD